MKTIFRLFLALLLLMPLAATASSWTGKITTIRYGTGSSPTPRVSILVGYRATPCGHPEWFSIDDANSTQPGVTSMWVDALLKAKSEGRTVTIGGTGTCDKYGIEIVGYIDIN